MTRTRSAAAAAPLKAVPAKKTKKAKAVEPKSETITSTNLSDALPWYHVFTKGDEEYNQYMANEWSFEKRGDVALFEKICLEGAQSGLSWQTILRKRQAYRRTFYNFDPHRVAQMTEADVQQILDKNESDPRNAVVRHKGKIQATIHNAKCLLEMQKKSGDAENTLDRFLWSFVNDKPILNNDWGATFDPLDKASLRDCPNQSPESLAMSKALKEKGWKFVGPTTCYALMQSCGMVVEHPVNSKEWKEARERLMSRPGGFQERNGSSSKPKP